MTIKKISELKKDKYLTKKYTKLLSLNPYYSSINNKGVFIFKKPIITYVKLLENTQIAILCVYDPNYNCLEDNSTHYKITIKNPKLMRKLNSLNRTLHYLLGIHKDIDNVCVQATIIDINKLALEIDEEYRKYLDLLIKFNN